MADMSTIELLLLGVLLAVVLLVLGPGMRGAWRQSKEAEQRDWAGVLWPVGLVVLFVLGLIWLAGGGR